MNGFVYSYRRVTVTNCYVLRQFNTSLTLPTLVLVLILNYNARPRLIIDIQQMQGWASVQLCSAPDPDKSQNHDLGTTARTPSSTQAR